MLLLLLLCFPILPPTIAYHHGGNETNCWYEGNPVPQWFCDAHVGSLDIHPAMSSSTSTMQQPEQNVTMDISTGDLLVYANEYFNVQAWITPQVDGQVVHANFHACRADVGYCTPEVRATPGLVSQSPPLVLGEVSRLVPTSFLQRFTLDEIGQWTLIAHITMVITYTANDDISVGGGATASDAMQPWQMPLNVPVNIDLANGLRVMVKQRAVLVPVDSWAEQLVVALSCIGLVLVTCVASFVAFQRHHWAMRVASVKLSLLIIVGSALGFMGAIVMLPPPLTLHDDDDDAGGMLYCNSRIWLLILGFDLILIPLTLKTWRVTVLFGAKSQFKRTVITDKRLLYMFGLVLMADVALCTAWTIWAPLHAVAIPSLLRPENNFYATCVIIDGPPMLQLGLELFVIFSHGAPLAWIALLGQRMRSAFRGNDWISSTSSSSTTRYSWSQQQGGGGSTAQDLRDKIKFCQFDESDAVSLTLLSMLFITIFAIGLQYTVEDSPTALALMTAGACIWTGFFTILIMFWPKVKLILRVENDGVTERSETVLMQARRSLLRVGFGGGGSTMASSSQDTMGTPKSPSERRLAQLELDLEVL